LHSFNICSACNCHSNKDCLEEYSLFFPQFATQSKALRISACSSSASFTLEELIVNLALINKSLFFTNLFCSQ
jgi:hypothetical protein